MRYRKPGKLCIQCGHDRPLTRYQHDRKRCDYCMTGAFRDTDAMRAALRYARTKALRDLPYTVPCAKCGHDRPSSYYPWTAGTARKGDTCNSCLRRRKGRGRPASVPDQVPLTPADHAQRAVLARIAEAEQARAAEQARIHAHGKRCNDCWHVKPATDYRVATARRDGLRASCMACERAFRALSRQQWRTAREALRACSGDTRYKALA